MHITFRVQRICVIAAIASLLIVAAPKRAQSCEVVCAVLIATGAVIVGAIITADALNDDEPEIGEIDVDVLGPPEGEWYVGQHRKVKVTVPTSFGHIRGKNQRGTIKMTATLGQVDYTEERDYTEEEDGKQSTYTCPGDHSWKCDIFFEFLVEAVDVFDPATMEIKVKVIGERDRFLRTDEKDVKVEKNAERNFTFRYPFKRTNNDMDEIGWLDPTLETINHMDCFDQDLVIYNCSTADGQIESTSISATTVDNKDFLRHFETAPDNRIPDYSPGSQCGPRTTVLGTGEVTHETGIPGHEDQQSFKTEWDMSGSDNIRLFLKGTKPNQESVWKNDGEVGPSPEDNWCNGLAGTCTPTPKAEAPAPKAINDTFNVAILSHDEPERPAANREVQVSDNNGFTNTYITNVNGEFTINQDPLGPLVSIDLVRGANSSLFIPNVLSLVSVELLDSSSEPFMETFYITEKEASQIVGRVENLANEPLGADLYAIDPADPGTEIYISRVVGDFSIDGIDQDRLGTSATATFRVRVDSDFNRDYTSPTVDFLSVPVNAGPIVLPPAVFTEVDPFVGMVEYRGTYQVRGLDGTVIPLEGLEIVVGGIPPVITDASGFFSIMVPAPASLLVSFPNARLLRPHGLPLRLPPVTDFTIEFGRGGSAVLDQGVEELDSLGIPISYTGTLSLWQGSLYYPIAYGGTLTGSGTAAIGGSYPILVRVPQNAFVAQTSGSLATPPPPYLSFGTQASFANELGPFSAGGGVGTLTQTVYGGSVTMTLGTVTVTPNANQFGGTLQLLGSLRRQTTRTTAMGGSLMASQGLPLGNVGKGQLTTFVTSTGIFGTTLTTARAWGARWTTGVVTVGTPMGSNVATSGYDNRTTLGFYGTLRLATPRLVATGPPPQVAKPGFAVLDLHFAPEPAVGIALAVGLLCLNLLWRLHRRSAPRR